LLVVRGRGCITDSQGRGVFFRTRAIVVVASREMDRISCLVYDECGMKVIHYNIVLQPEPEGGYTVLVPALPGCISYGKTLGAAKKLAQDAIVGYITSLKKHGQSIPRDDSRLVDTVRIKFDAKARTYA